MQKPQPVTTITEIIASQLEQEELLNKVRYIAAKLPFARDAIAMSTLCLIKKHPLFSS